MTYIRVKFAGPHPACATAEEYENWKRAAKGFLPAGFCTDCCPEHRDRMIAEGRCEHPTVQFMPDGDGYIPKIQPALEAQ